MKNYVSYGVPSLGLVPISQKWEPRILRNGVNHEDSTTAKVTRDPSMMGHGFHSYVTKARGQLEYTTDYGRCVNVILYVNEYYIYICIYVYVYMYMYMYICRCIYIYIYCLSMPYVYLVGGLEHFLFSHRLGIIITTDFHIFQSNWNHQPDIPGNDA